MMNRPVLIIGVEPRITLAIARSLHRHGIVVDVGSLATSDPRLHSRAVNDFLRINGVSPAAVAEELMRLIGQRGYDMLIPATDAALALISENDASLRRFVRVACPQAEVVQRVLNKSVTIDFARRVGIRVPECYAISDAGQLSGIGPRLAFPIVAKPSHKSKETDFKVRYFHSYESLSQAFRDDPHFGQRVLLQEFAPGDGVGIEMLIHGGEPLVTFQHRRLKEVPASGGAAAVAVSEAVEPILADQALTLLRSLEWEGVAMVEFRFDRQSKRSALMEVNGRYWGTLALPLHAGVDFPWYEWQLAHGERPEVPTDYPAGVRWRWTAGYLRRWHGLLLTSLPKVLRRPAALKELFPSIKDLGSADAVWKWDDPRPAVEESFRQTAHLVAVDAGSVLKKLGIGRQKRVESVKPAMHAERGDLEA
jgi:predicted ATP-grasp superfamily ATP-dependent carboligase